MFRFCSRKGGITTNERTPKVTDQNTEFIGGSESGDNAQDVYRPLKCDPDRYREDIADLGLTTEQENEVLRVLFDIMRTFAEIGYGIDPVQAIFSEMARKAMREDAEQQQESQPAANQKEVPN